jgi:hypothetical protein
MAVGKRLGVVKNAAREVVAVGHAVSARRTRRQVVSGGGETEKQAAGFGHGAARRYIATAAVEARQHGHGGASRGDAGAESWFENGRGNSGDLRRR